ncbi:SNF1-related protein kinase regulatory subunit beta-1-like [Iris pallida]|uniref:SNF1-related protein kinase regulatory subunit beta-1-like n=1 Tax=Iris pallida TaxID=29817 RepID=A0AAX6I4V2_IRIPA|nr:SNF1-related protein kinase regulatory subunit beta-1-like [Iris pallida]
MGNVNGHDGASGRSDGQYDSGPAGRTGSADALCDSPPESPRRSRSPSLVAPQVPVSPLQRPVDSLSPIFNQLRINDADESPNAPLEKGIPTLITWSRGGNEVVVQGSWDNWTSRRALHRSGKDHAVLLVLPSGIYHYKFIVDGEKRHIPDLPSISDETGRICNILDVTEYVPEDLASIEEFESPPSPVSDYSHTFLEEEEYAKEPPAVPPQLHLTVLGSENSEGPTPAKPQHVVLNHLFIEKGWASKSLVALGLTHRYRSKYVTVVVYKSLKSVN